jgi:hypothetical protein
VEHDGGERRAEALQPASQVRRVAGPTEERHAPGVDRDLRRCDSDLFAEPGGVAVPLPPRSLAVEVTRARKREQSDPTRRGEGLPRLDEPERSLSAIAVEQDEEGKGARVRSRYGEDATFARCTHHAGDGGRGHGQRRSERKRKRDARAGELQGSRLSASIGKGRQNGVVTARSVGATTNHALDASGRSTCTLWAGM